MRCGSNLHFSFRANCGQDFKSGNAGELCRGDEGYIKEEEEEMEKYCV